MTGGVRYPFGLSLPFAHAAIRIPDKDGLLHYNPNARQALAHNCCCDEMFYGGAVGGGKSWWIIWHNALHCMKWGAAANTILFRRSFPELEATLIKAQLELFDGKFGTYVGDKHIFRWNNGARTSFGHMQSPDDVRKYYSAEYTLIAFDELTDFTEKMYLDMFRRARSSKRPDILVQVLSASNPRGVGHKWVYERFIKDKEPNKVYEYKIAPFKVGNLQVPEQVYTRIFVPAKISDNTALLANDPNYLMRMRMSQSPDAWRAYVEGDWEYFEGMAFPDWDDTAHIVKAFNIPASWKVIRSMDHGFVSPFSVGWWSQDPDTQRIYRINEWYGVRRGPRGGVSGLQMSVDDIRQGIMDREYANVGAGLHPKVTIGPADPEIWQRKGLEFSVGTLINQDGVLFRAGNRDRPVGKAVFHRLLRINAATGRPGIGIFDTCKEFIRIFPMLVLEEKDGIPTENVESKVQEDHIYDEGRYAVVELTRAPARVRDYQQEQRIRKAYGPRIPKWRTRRRKSVFS